MSGQILELAGFAHGVVMQELHSAPFFSACNRPDLMLGCDRRLVILLFSTVGSLLMSSFSLACVIFSAMIFFGALRLFRKMAKADAKLFDVYQRHIRYRRYYAANSDPWKVNTTDDRARWCGSARDNF